MCRRQQALGQQPLLGKWDLQRNPTGPKEPCILLTKPHYYVITFVILDQTSHPANPLCSRAAHPSPERELTSKGIKRRRRLLEGSFEVSFYSCWLPPPSASLLRDGWYPSPLLLSFFARQASICSRVVLMELAINRTSVVGCCPCRSHLCLGFSILGEAGEAPFADEHLLSKGATKAAAVATKQGLLRGGGAVPPSSCVSALALLRKPSLYRGMQSVARTGSFLHKNAVCWDLHTHTKKK